MNKLNKRQRNNTLYCLFLNPVNLVLNPEPRTDFSVAATVPSDLPIEQPPVTWQPRQHRSTPVNAAGRRSTAAVHDGDRRSTPLATGQRRRITVVIGGQRWWSTTVADGEPPLTAAGPPLTITGPPVNDGWWAGQRAGLGRSGSGLGRVRVGSATCRATCQPRVHTCQPGVPTWHPRGS
nr:hypothetical protein [Tanacetum cinerariifolium]